MRKIEVLVAHLNVEISAYFKQMRKGKPNEHPPLMGRRVNARHLPSLCNEIINVIKWNINLMHNDVVERIAVFIVAT